MHFDILNFADLLHSQLYNSCITHCIQDSILKKISGNCIWSTSNVDDKRQCS